MWLRVNVCASSNENLSREASKCCAWQHQEGGPETRSGTVQSLKCCPCQQKRAARLPSAARIKEGGAKPSAAPGSIKAGGGPRNALGYRPEPEVLPLPAETSREAPNGPGQLRGGAPKRARAPSRACSAAPASRNEPQGGARNALGYRPEPEVLPLPAETSREAPKCCAWQHQGGGPETRSGTRGSQVQEGGPRNRAPSRA